MSRVLRLTRGFEDARPARPRRPPQELSWRDEVREARLRRARASKRRVLALVALSTLALVGAAQVPMTATLAIGLRLLQGVLIVGVIWLLWQVFRVADEASKARRGLGQVSERTRRRIEAATESNDFKP